MFLLLVFVLLSLQQPPILLKSNKMFIFVGDVLQMLFEVLYHVLVKSIFHLSFYIGPFMLLELFLDASN